MATSYHDMHTPIARPAVRRYIGSSVGARVGDDSSASEGPRSDDVVDALSYYFDNAIGLDMDSESSIVRRIGWEVSSTWKLLIEIYRMEALNDRLIHENRMDDASELNPLRDAFIRNGGFRRLLAVIRWLHWVNFEEAEQTGSQIPPSHAAYPLSGHADGSELPIDTILGEAHLIHPNDTKKERELCQAVWQLLTQGRVGEAIELCSSCGHHWRAGVLQAAVGHPFVWEELKEEEARPDWVEATIVGEDSGKARCGVKRTAMEILNRGESSFFIDEFDAAITGYLCGEEGSMRKAISSSSFSLNLWASLHCLKERFVADPMAADFNLTESLHATLAALETSMDLESTNQFKVLQSALITDDHAGAIGVCFDWVSDGIIKFANREYDVDLTSDAAATVLLRSFGAALVTVLRDVAGVGRLDEVQSTEILTSNIEALVAQFLGQNQLAEGNEIIVENLALLTDESVRTKMWAWYIRQYAGGTGWVWTVESSQAFLPMVSLLETFSHGAVRVVKLLLKDAVERRVDEIVSHSIGSSIDAGRELAFGVGAINSLWILAQSAAKSTGSGIYQDLCPNDEIQDPEEAAALLISSLASFMGEGLLVCMLADFTAAKAAALVIKASTVSASGAKLLSIQAALDSVNSDDEEDAYSVLETVSSFIHLLDRVSAVMERNSLLEQQKANMAKLTVKGGRGAGAVSAEARRQLMENQRLTVSITEMITKLEDEIYAMISEFLKADRSPLDPVSCAIDIDSPVWGLVTKTAIEVIVESAVQAIALLDDRRKHEGLIREIRSSKWIHSLILPRRLDDILAEIA